jgi:tetratricopeptide (TPR) repeat protein
MPIRSLAPRLRALAAAATLPVLVACQTTSETAETTSAATTEGVEAATPAPTSPMNEKSRERAAEWADAVRGLEFDTGRVVVDPALASRDPGRAAELIRDGDVALDGNRRTGAVRSYARAILADPTDPAAYRRLGGAMNMKGKTDLAIASYRTALDLDPDHVPTRVRLAETHARERQRDEAMAEMESVLARDPDHGLAHKRLATWRYYEGDLAAAWTHVHAAEAAGQPVPPQLVVLLEERMADPGPGAR